MKKTITSVGLILAASLAGMTQVGAAPMPSVSSTGTTVAPKTTVTTIAAKTTVTTTAPKTTVATNLSAAVVTQSSTGGVITFAVSGSTAKSFEIAVIYKGVTKYHKFTGTSLTLKGKAGNIIKFRIRNSVPKSSWGAWQTATVA